LVERQRSGRNADPAGGISVVDSDVKQRGKRSGVATGALFDSWRNQTNSHLVSLPSEIRTFV
jgi:hypothetical protein